MQSTQKIAVLIARLMFALIVIAGTLVLLARGASDSTDSRAKTQEQSRVVTKKPWSVEPVKVVAAKTKKKGNIEIGNAFDDDDDWLDGFTVTVVNNSDKTVTAMNLEMVFRRDAGDTRLPAARGLYFGPSPSSPAYLLRDPNKVIKPGQTAELSISAEEYQSLTRFLQRAGFTTSIRRVELVIREVGFEDGSVLQTGTLFLPDPKHPNDPTKKIRADKRFHHKPRHPRATKTNSQIALSNVSRISPVPDGCYARDFSHPQDCAFGCHTTNDLVDDFQAGTYTTEDVLVSCTRTLFNGEHECSDAAAVVPRFVQCTIPAVT